MPHLVPTRALQACLTALLGLTLFGCSDGSDTALTPTLGVPGSGDPHIVEVPAASLQGPVDGTPVLASTFFPLASVGYEQREYFVDGTARAYVNRNALQSDGRWQIQTDTEAQYRTRIVVIRPAAAADFNGSVVMEWLNVSAGFESAPDWGMLHTEMIRSGYAWVGVSAQRVGVQALRDGTAAAVVPGTPIDDRYVSLSHPGDNYSYDMFSQIASALREPAASGVEHPFADVSIERLIAAGESQSASRLLTYINALAPIHALFDGYFVHSRLGGSAPLQGDFLGPAAVPTPEVVRVRDDLGTPVMMVQTETDLFILGSFPDRQPDSERFRLWEVAGTAHGDLYTFLDNRFDVGDDPSVAAVVEASAPIPGIIECPLPVNAGPHHWVAKAALVALDRWIADGEAPPRAPRLEVAGEPPAFVLDVQGNVRGGVRTPYVDVPIAVLSGEGQPQPGFDTENRNFCFLSGTTELFGAAALGALYPSNAAYIEAVNTAAKEAVDKGFLLPADAELITTHAANSDIFSVSGP